MSPLWVCISQHIARVCLCTVSISSTLGSVTSLSLLPWLGTLVSAQLPPHASVCHLPSICFGLGVWVRFQVLKRQHSIMVLLKGDGIFTRQDLHGKSLGHEVATLLVHKSELLAKAWPLSSFLFSCWLHLSSAYASPTHQKNASQLTRVSCWVLNVLSSQVYAKINFSLFECILPNVIFYTNKRRQM